MKTKTNLTVGQTIYFMESSWEGLNFPKKVLIKNISKDGKYINFCECEDCKKREGTHEEYYKYDNAIASSGNIFTDYHKFKQHFLTYVNNVLNNL